MKTVELHITLSEAQAWELAQLRNNAASDAEAYHMRDAGEVIPRALAEQGYAPR